MATQSSMFNFLDTETIGSGPDDRRCQIAFKPENGPAVCESYSITVKTYLRLLSGK
jgi:hypothetical protein